MEHVDVVVVGSGYGGAVVATRLAQAGLHVVVLERGQRWASRDLVQSDDPRYIQQVYEAFVTTQNILYRTGNLVGGASINQDGAHFRIPQRSFEVTDEGGRRYWPEVYSRAELDPYYERAEAMLEVRQFPWDEIPKAGGLFAKMLDVAGASCERARMNYRDCLQCGFCSQGCIYDKKVTLLHSYIPLAESAGAEFRPDAAVDHIEPTGEGAYDVLYRPGGSGGEALESITGDRVVVACGGIHSPALLLRSATYLPGLSAHVGENFNTNGEHGYLGILPPEFDDLDHYLCYIGMENAGMMTFHWYEEEGFTLHPGGGFEPTIFAADLAQVGHPTLPSRSWGMAYKRFVESVYPHRIIGFSSLGLADSHFAVVVRGDGRTDMAPRDRTAYDAYLDRLDAVIQEISRASGVELFPSVPREMAGMTSAHLLASCRMAESVDDGVVDADCQVFGYENLYVCDASAIPYALAVNPALSIAAIAERVADRIIERG